jgi:hypothetical protein
MEQPGEGGGGEEAEGACLMIAFFMNSNVNPSLMSSAAQSESSGRSNSPHRAPKVYKLQILYSLTEYSTKKPHRKNVEAVVMRGLDIDSLVLHNKIKISSPGQIL